MCVCSPLSPFKFRPHAFPNIPLFLLLSPSFPSSLSFYIPLFTKSLNCSVLGLMISESKNDSCLMELVFLERVGRKLKRRKLKAETIWGEELSLDEVSRKASLGRGTVKGSLREADIRWPWNWGTKTQSKNTCRDICGQGRGIFKELSKGRHGRHEVRKREHA